MRLDRFLFCSRLAKSRTLSQALIAEGHVRLDGRRVERPSEEVRKNSLVTLPLRGRTLVLRVIALPTRRGPPAEARSCYAEIADRAASAPPDKPGAQAIDAGAERT